MSRFRFRFRVQGSGFRVQGSLTYATPPAPGGVRPARCRPSLPAPSPASVRLVDVGGVRAGEADAQLGVARGIRIERVTGNEGDAGGQRAIQQGSGADVRGDAAPQIEPPRDGRTGAPRREVALDRRDHRRTPLRVLGADRHEVRVEAAWSRISRGHRELDQVLRVRVEPLLDDRDLIDDRRRGRQASQAAARAPAPSRSCSGE